MKATENLTANKTDMERYAVSVFGVTFLASMVTLPIWIPKLSSDQFFGFRLTLELAAASVGAIIPGFIQFEQVLPHKGLLRCGGAIALFATVWFTNPAKYALEYSLLSDRDQACGSQLSFMQLGSRILQETKVWCRAAVAQQIIMASKGQQNTSAQCALVATANGAPQGFCCNGYNPVCVRTGTISQTQNLIAFFGGKASTHVHPTD